MGQWKIHEASSGDFAASPAFFHLTRCTGSLYVGPAAASRLQDPVRGASQPRSRASLPPRDAWFDPGGSRLTACPSSAEGAHRQWTFNLSDYREAFQKTSKEKTGPSSRQPFYA